MAETDIDSALLDLIVREVVRRLRGGAGTGGPGGGAGLAGGIDGPATGMEDGRPPGIESARGQCRDWEHCPFKAAERVAAGSSSPPEHETVSLRGRVVVEEDIKRALAGGARGVRIGHRAIVTPLARDTAREKNLTIERVSFDVASAGWSGIQGGGESSGP